jgi:hypothetical protein
MSTKYVLTNDISIVENSCHIQFLLDDDELCMPYMSSPLGPETLRKIIVEQIKILSYIVDDPDEVLKRFNVDYLDKE